MSEDGNEFVESFSDSEIQKLVQLQNEMDYFTWQDAKNKGISMNMWGKSIEKNIIIEYEKGYQLTVEFNNLEESQENSSKFENPKWDYKDKVVLAVSLLASLSFSVNPLRNLVYSITNVPLSYVSDFLPLYVTIILLSAVSSLWSVYIRERLDTNIEDYESRINDIKGELTDDEDTSIFSATEDMSEEQTEEVKNLQIAILKMRVLPILWTLVLTIPIIIWIIVTTNTSPNITTITYPIFGEHFWAGEIYGPIKTWIPLYAFSSLLLSQTAKKLYFE